VPESEKETKRIVWTEQARTDVRSVEQLIAESQNAGSLRADGRRQYKAASRCRAALLRLRAQDHRIFFRDKGEYLEISRVLNRKEAYR
jgi:plasmid stabilization system protein ParE